MPTSHRRQLNEIVELIILLNPQSILDVGVGFGKYGVLAREYLELLDGRKQYHDWQRRIEGVEAFAGYITPLHHFIYDHLYIGDAAEVLADLTSSYDLILMIDVIEHFTPERGAAVLQACLQIGRNVLISTPKQFFNQEGFDNPYEQHRSHWQQTDLAAFSPHCFIPNDFSLICLLGSDTTLVRQTIRHPRRRISQSLPFLKRPYHTMKKLFLYSR